MNIIRKIAVFFVTFAFSLIGLFCATLPDKTLFGIWLLDALMALGLGISVRWVLLLRRKFGTPLPAVDQLLRLLVTTDILVGFTLAFVVQNMPQNHVIILYVSLFFASILGMILGIIWPQPKPSITTKSQLPEFQTALTDDEQRELAENGGHTDRVTLQ